MSRAFNAITGLSKVVKIHYLQRAVCCFTLFSAIKKVCETT